MPPSARRCILVSRVLTCPSSTRTTSPAAARRDRAAARRSGGAAAADPQTLLRPPGRRRSAASCCSLLILFFVVRGCAQLAQGERAARTTTARSPSIVDGVRHAGRRAVLRAARPGRERVAAGPADARSPATASQAEQQLEQAQDLERAGRDERRPAVAADRARVPPRRARRDRRADPHRARRRGRGGRRGDQRDRRPDAGLPRLRRALPDARVAARSSTALDDADVGGQTIAASQFLPGSSGCSATYVADQLGQQLTGGGGSGKHAARPAPGLHGTGLESVDASATRRCSPARRTGSPTRADTAFASRSPTRARTTSSTSRSRCTIEGGGKPITLTRDGRRSSPKGADRDGDARARQAPPLGAAVTITVDGRAGPGREEDRQQQGDVPRRSSTQRVAWRRQRSYPSAPWTT